MLTFFMRLTTKNTMGTKALENASLDFTLRVLRGAAI